jgi:hypothetical protein
MIPMLYALKIELECIKIYDIQWFTYNLNKDDVATNELLYEKYCKKHLLHMHASWYRFNQWPSCWEYNFYTGSKWDCV